MSRTPTVAPALLTGANPSVYRGGDIGEEFQSTPRSAIEFSRLSMTTAHAAPRTATNIARSGHR